MSFFELNPNLREQFAEQRAQNEQRLQAQIAEQQEFREKLNADLKKRADEAAARDAQPPHETVFDRIREKNGGAEHERRRADVGREIADVKIMASGNQTANKQRDGKFAPHNKLGNRFKPGQSGNPQGRPKLTLLSEALREQLAEVLPGVDERTIAEHIARSMIKQALLGNVIAAREIADRTEGRPKQSVDVDMSVRDWREMARTHGLSEQDVIREAQLLIEPASD